MARQKFQFAMDQKQKQAMMMYSKPFFILICSLFLISSISNAQTQDSITSNSVPDSLSFPHSWVGHWQGTLDIYNAKGLAQTVAMELEISPIDGSENFNWAIIYGEDKVAGRRAYELEIVDPAKGWYAIDEKNTIRLEAYLFNNKLYSRFEVMGNWLLSSYEMQNNQLRFEIISGQSEAVSTTGGQTFEKEEIPEVNAFPINVHQSAVLTKVK